MFSSPDYFIDVKVEQIYVLEEDHQIGKLLFAVNFIFSQWKKNCEPSYWFLQTSLDNLHLTVDVLVQNSQGFIKIDCEKDKITSKNDSF